MYAYLCSLADEVVGLCAPFFGRRNGAARFRRVPALQPPALYVGYWCGLKCDAHTPTHTHTRTLTRILRNKQQR